MKHAVILGLFVLTAIVLSIVQIVFGTLYTTAGLEISQIQTQKQAVDKENMLLSEKLYTLSSLTNIEASAKQLGFEDETSKSMLVVTQNSAFALKP